MDRKLRIFLCFQYAFNPPRHSQRCDLFGCDDFDIVAKPLGWVRVTSPVLRKAGIKING
jgi:hypothetical protein